MVKGAYLAEFEFYVMLAVLRLAGEGYGVTIRREIEERTGRPVSIGAVYATLGRLQDKGLVELSVSEPLPVRGGRARNVAQLTKAGHSALETSSAMMRSMMDGTPLADPT